MKSHLKRLVTPKSWTLLKKKEKFVVRPRPGSHPAKDCMPITLLLKTLGYASTTSEVKKILNTKEVLVDGKRVKEHKFPVGLMDVLTIKDTNESFRVIFDKKGRLGVLPVEKDEQHLKLCRVKKKTALKKGKVQLNLSDNRNILTDKTSIKSGDSVLITVPFQEIKEHFPLEKGALIYLIGGRNIGHKGTVESIYGNKLVYTDAKKKHESLKIYAFVVGKNKEAIKLG